MPDDPPTPETEPPPDRDPSASFDKERAFLMRCMKEGVVAPNAALAMADFSKLEVNEAGEVFGLDQLFAKLREKEPALFQSRVTPGLDQRPASAPTVGADLKRAAQASGLTRDIQAYRRTSRG